MSNKRVKSNYEVRNTRNFWIVANPWSGSDIDNGNSYSFAFKASLICKIKDGDLYRWVFSLAHKENKSKSSLSTHSIGPVIEKRFYFNRKDPKVELCVLGRDRSLNLLCNELRTVSTAYYNDSKFLSSFVFTTMVENFADGGGIECFGVHNTNYTFHICESRKDAIEKLERVHLYEDTGEEVRIMKR